jgi:hypothetical protein
VSNKNFYYLLQNPTMSLICSTVCLHFVQIPSLSLSHTPYFYCFPKQSVLLSTSFFSQFFLNISCYARKLQNQTTKQFFYISINILLKCLILLVLVYTTHAKIFSPSIINTSICTTNAPFKNTQIKLCYTNHRQDIEIIVLV